MNKKEKTIFKKGIYQFLIDHSTKTAKGFYINFFIDDEQDLWKRIRAREKGYYSRKDILEEKENLLKVIEQYRKYKQTFNWVQKRQRKFNVIKNNGGLYIKFLFWIKKQATNLILKNEK